MASSPPPLPTTVSAETKSDGSDPIYKNTCEILSYMGGVYEQLKGLRGEAAQLATFGTDLRTSARVANTSTATLQAWQTQLSSYIDPKLIFKLANNAIEDSTVRKGLQGIGVDQQALDSKNVDKIALSIIEKLPDFYQKNRHNGDAVVNQFKSFDASGSYRDIARNLANLPKDELRKELASLPGLQERLGMSDNMLRQEQRLRQTMDEFDVLLSKEKLKNSYNAAGTVATEVKTKVEAADKKARDVDDSTHSSGGYGYAIADTAVRLLVPALQNIESAFCSAPIKKGPQDKEKDHEPPSDQPPTSTPLNKVGSKPPPAPANDNKKPVGAPHSSASPRLSQTLPPHNEAPAPMSGGISSLSKNDILNLVKTGFMIAILVETGTTINPKTALATVTRGNIAAIVRATAMAISETAEAAPQRPNASKTPSALRQKAPHGEAPLSPPLSPSSFILSESSSPDAHSAPLRQWRNTSHLKRATPSIIVKSPHHAVDSMVHDSNQEEKPITITINNMTGQDISQSMISSAIH